MSNTNQSMISFGFKHLLHQDILFKNHQSSLKRKTKNLLFNS